MRYVKENRQYTREELLAVLASYDRMIDRNAKEYPTVCLSDIQASIHTVLGRNNYEDKYKSYSMFVEVK